jgi:hypothetical protein
MKPTFRLVRRTAFSVIFMAPLVLYATAYLLLGLNGEPLYLWAFAFTFVVAIGVGILFRRLIESELISELKERNGKPIKVVKLGKWNVHFLDRFGFFNAREDQYPVLVNPKPGRYTFVKYLYMPAVNSKTLSDELLEIAATSQPAYEEIAKKIERHKWTTKYDAQSAETANTVAQSIADILT